MDHIEILPETIQNMARLIGTSLMEIRLRRGRNVWLIHTGGESDGGILDKQSFDATLDALMGHSLYAHKHELDNGYFTLPGGVRAGISGCFRGGGPRNIEDITTVCIRIPHEVTGCADQVMDTLYGSTGALIISPPGLGKTTMLRDVARQFSNNGRNVCVIDERDEIAACINGAPSLDLGPRADVFTGCSKSRGIMMALRSCAPDVIITDEVGNDDDERALMELRRCGVRLVASAHGNSLEKLRPALRRLVDAEVFDMGILLGPSRGRIAGTKWFGRDAHG